MGVSKRGVFSSSVPLDADAAVEMFNLGNLGAGGFVLLLKHTKYKYLKQTILKWITP